MKLHIIIDENDLDGEDLLVFKREARKATGIHITVGRPVRKPEVRGMGDVETVPSRTFTLETSKFEVKVK